MINEVSYICAFCKLIFSIQNVQDRVNACYMHWVGNPNFYTCTNANTSDMFSSKSDNFSPQISMSL